VEEDQLLMTVEECTEFMVQQALEVEGRKLKILL